MLILLPNLLDEKADPKLFLPASVWEVMRNIDGLFAESEKGGRRFLGRFETKKRAHEIPLALINEHTKNSDLDFYLEPLLKGEIWGLVSDCGMPLVADPGSDLVRRARERNIEIKAISGPSSILLALVLSGQPAQSFFFHGYIAKDIEKRKAELLMWEKLSKNDRSTHIFIEAPYRNHHTFEAILETLDDATLFTLASSLTSPEERVITKTIKQWKKEKLVAPEKVPTIFLISSNRY